MHLVGSALAEHENKAHEESQFVHAVALARRYGAWQLVQTVRLEQLWHLLLNTSIFDVQGRHAFPNDKNRPGLHVTHCVVNPPVQVKQDAWQQGEGLLVLK